MVAHPDVEPAMRTLVEGGVRVNCLTNAAPETTQGFLDRAGLAGYVESVITTSELPSWKPPAKVYHHACDRLALPPERVALVAAHAWDCHGAKRAGLLAGWVSRLEGGYDEIFDPADAVGDTLDEVARALLALPR